MDGGGIGNGNLHEHTNLPCLMAGKLGGTFTTGYHHDDALDKNVPMANLLLTLLDRAGVPTTKRGDSTGLLEREFLSV